MSKRRKGYNSIPSPIRKPKDGIIGINKGKKLPSAIGSADTLKRFV